MIRVLIVSSKNKHLGDLKAGLEENKARIFCADTCEAALLKTGEEKLDLIITDENLTDAGGLACLKTLIASNPMLNCAAISSLSHDDFHEASEGLGLLAQLPAQPEKKDADHLIERLNSILSLMKRR